MTRLPTTSLETRLMNRQTVSKDAMGLQKMKNHESGEVFIFMVSPTILHLVSRSRSRETVPPPTIEKEP